MHAWAERAANAKVHFEIDGWLRKPAMLPACCHEGISALIRDGAAPNASLER